MNQAPHPSNEAARLAALRAYDVLDTKPEAAFDDLTWLASRTFDVPIALVSLIDDGRQWFKSRTGLDASETPRSLAFCAHSILRPAEVTVVPDAVLDLRFSDHPFVIGEPHIRFYAGAPLVTADGFALGTLCIVDDRPRSFGDGECLMLQALARQVLTQLELRKACTELAVVVDRIEHVNHELEEFTHIAAHDLQEPLRKLVSFSGLLISDAGPDLPEAAVQDVGFITDAAKRMQQLITDLLELSRVGTSDRKPTRFNLSECVDAALDALSVRVIETGARIESETLSDVVGDRALLTQLFQNLIGNALKFVGKETPSIRITCEHRDGETVIGVRDNGIGMEPRYAERVFSPFTRLHGRGAYPGTGIGLSIARKAVEHHDGRIWVESEPGQGAHFRFALTPPVIEADDETINDERRAC